MKSDRNVPKRLSPCCLLTLCVAGVCTASPGLDETLSPRLTLCGVIEDAPSAFGELEAAFSFFDPETRGLAYRSITRISYLNGLYVATLPATNLVRGKTYVLFVQAPSSQGNYPDAAPSSYVRLQDVTPGDQQVGNANISGKMIAGFFEGDGSLLVNVRLTLPYSQTVASGSDAFLISNSANGGAVRGESNTGTGVYGKQNNSGNFGYLGSDIYGLYAKHDASGNYGFVGSSGWALYAKHAASNNHGYIGSADYGIYGIHSATGNFGFFGNLDYGAYGEHGPTRNFGLVGASVAAVYGQTGNNRTYGFLADDDYGAGGKHVLNNNRGYLGTSIRGVWGVHGASGNEGYLGSSNYGVYGQTAGPNFGYLGGSTNAMFASHGASGSYGYVGNATYGAYAQHGASNNFGYLGSSSYGAYGKHSASGNYGYFGSSAEGAYVRHNATGHFARIADSAQGVYAQAGGNIGILADSSGRGVYGGGTAYGVYGLSGTGRGVYGQSVTDVGVYGLGSEAAGVNYGVWAESLSPSGRGLFGRASAVSGTNYGVRGLSLSPDGYGLYSFSSDAKVDGDLTVVGAKVGYVADIVLNGGQEELTSGDLVEIIGAAEPVVGRIPVIVVRKTQSAASRSVLGPIECAVRLTAVEEDDLRETPPGKTPERWHVHRADGAISPGGYGRVVTLGAFERVKADASFGPIRPGDLLVSSSTPGYAMALKGEGAAVGIVIGKALGPLQQGLGEVAVLVQSR